jgi:hypothetical protein
MAFKNIEDWAGGTGHTRTLALRRAGSPEVGFSAFDPEKPGLGRYGFTNADSAGSTSEHRASLDGLEAVIRRQDNPFQLEGHESYTPSNQDLQDTQYLVWAGSLSVYDALVLSDAAPTTPPIPPAQPGTPTPPAPFERMTDRELQEDMALKLNYLQAASMRIEAALARPQPQITAADDEGKALAALKKIRTIAFQFKTSLGDRKAEGDRAFIATLDNLLAEGGA